MKNQLAGKRFTRLLVVSHAHTRNYNQYWNCVCDCGNTVIVSSKDLGRGHKKSCGCLQQETQTKGHPTHELSYTSPVYHVWSNMKRRCLDAKNPAYKNYGGRGITVCPEWENSFEDFHKWCMASGYEKGKQIDRRDNSLGYTPENCRFITAKENCRNTRANVLVTIDGITRCLKEWAEHNNISPATINSRLIRGWEPVTAVTKTPKRMV